MLASVFIFRNCRQHDKITQSVPKFFNFECQVGECEAQFQSDRIQFYLLLCKIKVGKRQMLISFQLCIEQSIGISLQVLSIEVLQVHGFKPGTVFYVVEHALEVLSFNFVRGEPETLKYIQDCVLRVKRFYHYKNSIETKAKLRVQ